MSDLKDTPVSEPLVLDSAGISDDDQKEILKQIETVATQNRIQASPELLAVKAKKKGLFVPLMVNAAGLVVLFAGLLVLYLLFRQNEMAMVRNQVNLQSNEGKLIEELKKDSENKLLAKDQQIADIQKRMEAVDKERSDLQTNMDAKVKEKELALRKQLNDELEAERQRLKALGYSEEAIQQRLKEFEARKTAEFNQALKDFAKKAEAERLALENNLKQQQADFQKNLGALNDERQKIQTDAKKREQELQTQLDQKSKDLETQQSKARDDLAKAQQELSKLNEQKDKTTTVTNQIQGLYMKTSQLLQARQYTEALAQVQTLLSYLNDDNVKSLPDIQKRRDTDLALATTLEDFFKEQIQKQDADAARLKVTDNTISTIQDLAKQAEVALKAGKEDQANDLYQKALQQIPEVLASHEYFLKKTAQLEQARQQRLLASLKAGDDSLAKGDFADAVKQYNLVIDELPLGALQRDVFKANITKASFETGDKARKDQVEAQVKADLTAAGALLTAGKADEAMGAYAAILEKYPMGTAGFSAIKGIQNAALVMEKPSPRIAELEKSLAEVKAERDKLLEAPKTGTLEDELKRTQADLAKSKDQWRLAQDQIAQLNEQINFYEQMKAQYKRFTANDDQIWKSSGSSTVFQARVQLDNFLNSNEMSKTFPGLKDHFDRFDRAYRDAAIKESMVNVNEIIGNLLKLGNNAERKLYMNILKDRYAKDPTMKDFVLSLSYFF